MLPFTIIITMHTIAGRRARVVAKLFDDVVLQLCKSAIKNPKIRETPTQMKNPFISTALADTVSFKILLSIFLHLLVII